FVAGGDDHTLTAGAVGQALMTRAPRYGLGLCPIGSVTSSPLRETLQLAASDAILYSFEGGAITADQTERWPVEAAASPAQEVEALREYLRAKLPAYMVPSLFVPIDRLPLNQNG